METPPLQTRPIFPRFLIRTVSFVVHFRILVTFLPTILTPHQSNLSQSSTLVSPLVVGLEYPGTIDGPQNQSHDPSVTIQKPSPRSTGLTIVENFLINEILLPNSPTPTSLSLPTSSLRGPSQLPSKLIPSQLCPIQPIYKTSILTVLNDYLIYQHPSFQFLFFISFY